MKPSKQDFFNQFREQTIIEVVQTVAKSRAGSQIAFKGGTALKLFYGLPRYSEDIDYDALPGSSPQELMRVLKGLFVKRRWEITDEAIKYFTVLSELRFAGPERRFRVKIEISTREKELETTIQSFRGVPILTLEPSFLMTEKLLTFLDRQAGRDIFDAWFILDHGYPLKESLIKEVFAGYKEFYQAMAHIVEGADRNKILRDTGKLLGQDYRNWIRTSFLDDFIRLIRDKLDSLQRT
ncbi:MAG: nucleotidyl transferase AbiEii/AbiGii toxin family protein [Thermodesulfobacteriota bacterium]